MFAAAAPHGQAQAGCNPYPFRPVRPCVACRFGFSSAADVQHGFETAHMADQHNAVKVMFDLAR